MKTAAELCEGLLSCAGQHGDAEGSEAQIGDLEDFFRVAFDLLTPEQLGRFLGRSPGRRDRPGDPGIRGTRRGDLSAGANLRMPTVRTAPELPGITLSATERPTVSVPEDQKIPVTFTHVERVWRQDLPGRRALPEPGRRPGHRPRGHARRSRRPEMGDHGRRSRRLARRTGPAARPRRLPGRLRHPDARPNLTLATKGKPDGQTLATPLLALRGAEGLLRPDQLAGHADPRRQFGRWPVDRHLREDAGRFRLDRAPLRAMRPRRAAGGVRDPAGRESGHGVWRRSRRGSRKPSALSRPRHGGWRDLVRGFTGVSHGTEAAGPGRSRLTLIDFEDRRHLAARIASMLPEPWRARVHPVSSDSLFRGRSRDRGKFQDDRIAVAIRPDAPDWTEDNRGDVLGTSFARAHPRRSPIAPFRHAFERGGETWPPSGSRCGSTSSRSGRNAKYRSRKRRRRPGRRSSMPSRPPRKRASITIGPMIFP